MNPQCSHFRLTIYLSIHCTPPFFLLGETCSKFCQEKNDPHGHYTCTGNGDKECRAGSHSLLCDGYPLLYFDNNIDAYLKLCTLFLFFFFCSFFYLARHKISIILVYIVCLVHMQSKSQLLKKIYNSQK